MLVARDSWFVVRGNREFGIGNSWSVVRGSWFVARGSWEFGIGNWEFVVRGPWFVIRGNREFGIGNWELATLGLATLSHWQHSARMLAPAAQTTGGDFGLGADGWRADGGFWKQHGLRKDNF